MPKSARKGVASAAPAKSSGSVRLAALLKAIGFQVETENADQLTFRSRNGHELLVEIDPADPKKSKIDNGSAIKVHHKGCRTFQNPESEVVVECVVRLLDKGYAPKHIELEKTWPAGHGHSGRLDVLVRKPRSGVFAMIECKTWGAEYQKERAKMLDDGGQLFSYAIQENTTQYALLYASRVAAGKLTFVAEQVDYKDLTGANQEERFASWDKSFVANGIFAEGSPAYDSRRQNLKKADLLELDQESGRGLFNSFAEILRRHAISDKSNAFNKIFNLFVCKIYDEDSKRDAEELDFQWKIVDSSKKLLEVRLAELYRKGLEDYLQIDVSLDYFSPLAEFAFVDIYDKDTYDRNASIIREVVELLQQYRIRYTSKHQFLGDFFEDLLNTGIKQEAGQFFTPTILARFFIKSLPVRELVDSNIQRKEQSLLPAIIDFACGAGHFLTEAIDEVQEKIDAIDVDSIVGRAQKQFIGIRENFLWAKEYVYGIEKDYRLAKTTKIAMFLNGDGDAVIVNGDGLGDFKDNSSFIEKLESKKQVKYLEHFDVLISNPPFSISGFKLDVQNVAANFELAAFVSPKGREIECFFLERAGQLIKENGVIGIILPLSILNNETRVYKESRKLLAISYDICGIVELRDKTFKPTGTTTVGIFLRKREQKALRDATTALCRAIILNEGSKNARSTVALCEKRGIDNKALTDEAKEVEVAILSDEGVRITGIGLPDRFAYALAAYLQEGKDTVVAYAGEKKDQEAFLGYRFSKSRGREGLEVLRTEEGTLLSSLYDEKNLGNPEKVNAHILANFNGSQLVIPQSLETSVDYIRTTQLINPQTMIFDNPSSYFTSANYAVESISPFGDFVEDYGQEPFDIGAAIQSGMVLFIGGLVYNKQQSEVPSHTSKRVITASNIDLKTGRLDLTTKLIYLHEGFTIPKAVQPRKGDILISIASGSLKQLGKVAWVDEDLDDYAVGGFLSIFRISDKKLAKALFYRLSSLPFRRHIAGLRGQNINNLDIDKIAAFSMTLPKDLAIFEKDAEAREEELRKITGQLNKLRK